jgi:hypothetical protein
LCQPRQKNVAVVAPTTNALQAGSVPPATAAAAATTVTRVQGLRPFDRIRRQRHDVEYPPTDAPQITAEDVRDDAAKAAAMVDLSERILDQMSPF